MEKVKIKSKDQGVYGKTINLPIDGEVKVSAEGEIEVSQKCADMLMEFSNDFTLVEEEVEKKATKPKVKSTKEKEEEEEDVKDEEEEDEEDEEDVPYTKESLKELELSELQEIIKGSGIAKAKYAKVLNNKTKLINFILKSI